jgi:hypothetical protein
MMDDRESEPPETIYLQWSGSPDETTWCTDRIEAEDVEYVRADLVAELRKYKAVFSDCTLRASRLYAERNPEGRLTFPDGAESLAKMAEERANTYRRRALALTGLRGKERRAEFLPRLEEALAQAEHWKGEAERLRAVLERLGRAFWKLYTPEGAQYEIRRIVKEALEGGE